MFDEKEIKDLAQSAIDTEAIAQEVAEQIDVPTKTSELTNDSGFVTSSELATVATSGDYDDLTNKPTIPVVPTDVSAFTNDAGYISGITSSDVTAALGYTPGTSNFSGDYDDLTDKPDLSVYAESADLATVATTGDYDDLTNKPTIPTVSDATITFTQGGTTKGTITLNQSGDSTIALDAGGSGGSYTAGNGISIDTNDEISVDTSVVVDTTSSQTITAAKTMEASAGTTTRLSITVANASYPKTSAAPRGFHITKDSSNYTDVWGDGTTVYKSSASTKLKYDGFQRISGGNVADITLPTTSGTLALTSDIPTSYLHNIAFTGGGSPYRCTVNLIIKTNSATPLTSLQDLHDLLETLGYTSENNMYPVSGFQAQSNAIGSTYGCTGIYITDESNYDYIYIYGTKLGASDIVTGMYRLDVNTMTMFIDHVITI